MAKNLAMGDFKRWLPRRLRKFMQGQHRHMITGELSVIQANALKNRLFLSNDSSLFPGFAFRRVKNCLAPFDSTTGQKPTRPIGMLDQQNPVFHVKNSRSRAQCEAPRLAVNGLQGNF